MREVTYPTVLSQLNPQTVTGDFHPVRQACGEFRVIEVVAYVREKGAARRERAGNFQRLSDGKVCGVRGIPEGVNHQHVEVS